MPDVKKFFHAYSAVALFLKKHKSKFVMAVTILAIFIVITTATRTITTQPLLADDAFNLQAPYNLVKIGSYASFGAVWEGADKVFDPYLTTGPIISLPITLVFKIFGIGIVQARIVMLLLYIATLVLTTWFVYDETHSGWSILMPLTYLTVLDKFVNYPIAVLGEYTAIGLVVGSMFFWRKRRYLFAGILSGAAILSKFLMLLLPIAAVFCFGWLLLTKKSSRKQVFKNSILYVIGCGGVLFFWELYRFVQLGFSRHAYKVNLIQFVDYFKVNGSGLSVNGTKLDLLKKLDMIIVNFSATKMLLTIALICLLWLAWQTRSSLLQRIKQHTYGLIFLALYGGWWFFKSNGAYTRYVLPLALISMIIYYCLVLGSKPRSNPSYSLAAAMLLITLVIATANNYWTSGAFKWPRTLEDQKQVARHLEDVKPSNLAHVGWWQNPEILFLSGYHSRVTHSLSRSEDYQVLLGPAMHESVPKDYARAKSLCRDVVFEKNGYTLCTGKVEANRPVE